MQTATVSSSLLPIYKLLKITFGVVPIVAGLDKFSNVLTDWTQYLHPGLVHLLPISPAAFMMIVGVIEIVAGILVFIRPAAGALVVTGWLALIAVSLLASGNYLDVAVRDLVMAAGSYSLFGISRLILKHQANGQ